MAGKKDPYTKPQEWHKHMRKGGRRIYRRKVRSKTNIRINKLLKKFNK